MNRMSWLAATATVFLMGAGPVLADKPDWAGGGKGPGGGDRGHGPQVDHGRGGQSKAEKGGGGRSRLSQREIVVVHHYFNNYHVDYAPLPPGIRKKLARGKPLPPGIARRMAPIELRQQIPMCMNGWECILAGADMLILDSVHGTVRDIVRGVVR